MRAPFKNDEAEIRMRRMYKNVFASAEGQEVGKDIVFTVLGAMRDDLETEGDIACANAGRYILNMIGCSDSDKAINSIWKSLISIPAIVGNNEEVEE